MRTMKKRWPRLLIIVLAVLVCLPVLIFLFIQTPAGEFFVFQQLRSYLRGRSDVSLKATDFHLNLFKGIVRLENPEVQSASKPDMPPLFKAARVEAQLSISDAIHKRWIIDRLVVAAPQIHYYVDPSGRTNLPEAPGASGKTPDVLIRRAEVTNGNLSLQDLRREISLLLPRWQLTVNGDPSTRAHDINFAVRQDSIFGYRNRTIPINSIELSGTLQKSSAQIESIQISAANSKLSIAGTIRDFSKPDFRLRLVPDLDLSRIVRIAGSEEKIAGRISGTASIKGTLDRIQVETQLKASNFSALDYHQTGFDLKTKAEWIRDSGKLSFDSFDLASPQGFVTGRAELFPGPEQGTNSIEATFRNLNLEPLWKEVKAGFDLASRADGRIALRWNGPIHASTLAGNAHLTLTASRPAPDSKTIPASGVIDAQLQPGRISGDIKSLGIFGAQVSGHFALQSFRDIEGVFEGDATNIHIPIAQASRFLGEPDGALARFPIAGPVRFNARISGSLSHPKIITAVDTPSLQISTLKNLSARTDATIEGSRIAFKDTIALPQDSIISATGTLDLGGRDTILEVDANSDQLALSAVMSVLDIRIPATGNLKARLHLSGPMENLAGNASITGDGLSIYQESLGHLDTDLLLANGEIQSSKFKLLRNPQNPDENYLDAQFTYALDAGRFQFQAKGKNLAIAHPASKSNSTIQGTVTLDASGNGTIENPSVDLKLESSDLQVRQKPLGPVSVIAELRNEALTINTLVPNFNISSSALVTVRDPYPFKGELHAKNSDLSRLELKGANGQPITGALNADFTGSGNLREPARTAVSARIQSMQLQAGQLEVHTQDPIRMEYRDNSLELLSAATIISGNSKLEITGKVPVRQPASEGTLRFKGQLDLAQASGFAPVPKGFAATGIFNLDFSLAGTAQKVSSAGTIVLDNGTVQLPWVPVPLTNVAIRANVQDGAFVLTQAGAAWGEGKIALTGEFPFGLLPRNLPVQFPRKEGSANFALDLINIRPELSGAFPREVRGLISMHASGRSASIDVRALTAQIQFSTLNLRLNNNTFSQKESSAIMIRDGIASVSRLALIGTETNLEIGGSVGFLRNGILDLRLIGDVDAALLTSISKDLKLAGKLQVKMNAAGSLKAPVLSGLASMSGGRLTLRSPRIIADSLNLLVSFTPNQITVNQFSGTLNGGIADLQGTIGYRSGTLNDFNLKANLQDFFLNFPDGLKSVSSGDLTITSSDDSILINGTMRVRESSYREPMEVGSQLISYLKAQQIVEVGQEPSPILDRIRLNIGIRTTAPLLVQNNIAKVEATANLRIVGSFYEPSMTGRVTLNEGGEIILNQRTYYITRGTITLTNQSYIEPDLNIQAQTKVDTYEITLQLTGTLERLTTTLTSEPALAEADILSLLLTGKTASETQTPGIVQTQALSLLAGEAGEQLTRGARQALHLSTFRIDPGLLTSESDPGARLTLGQDIAKGLSLAYSMNLVNGGDQIWAAQYNITRRISAQTTKQQDNTYRLEFRHDLRLGGTSSTRASRRQETQKLRIGSIKLQGGDPFPDKILLDKFNVESGDKYDFPKVQKGLDRLRDFYAGQKRLEADVRMQRETAQKTVDLKLNISPGPIVDFSYDGFPLSGSVKEKVENAWKNGAFETERVDDAVMAIRRALIQEGYPQSEVTYKMETGTDQKLVHFQISPGARYVKIPVIFPGASEISAAELNNALDLANLKLDLYADPQKPVDYLERYYHERGYLQARVDLPQLSLNPQTGSGQVSLRIQEGPLFTIGDLEFIGNRAFDYDQLWAAIPTSSGSSYDPKTLRDAVKAMENLYRSKGYNDVSIAFRVVQDSKTAHANLSFQIMERRQSIIRDIVIEGNQDTSRVFVERQLEFKIGDLNNYAKIDESRKRLYATGVYSSVDFQTEDMPATAPNAQVKDVRIQVRLREIRPYRLQYGLFYDTQRGPGGLLEAQNMNFLGRASNLGLRFRYDTDLKEGRLFFTQPFVKQIHVKMDSSVFAQRETREGFSATRVGFSLIRELQLPRKFRFDYGYRYDHVRWKGLPPDPTIFQASDPVARLIATISRDTRDSILDPTRGEFSSHSLEFGPTWLGSERGFARYYGQYSRYVPLDKFLGWPRKDKEGRSIPPKLVYAGAIRLGLTAAFAGQSIIAPERFFAGGGTTMRGFKQDLLGPLVLVDDQGNKVTDPASLPEGTKTFLRPTGGEALFLFNNEIRFPIVGILQGVGFLDLGNVYTKISSIHGDIRKSAGAGLRIKIKYVPLRFDYGFKLDRRPGESGSEFFFSIGQAF